MVEINNRTDYELPIDELKSSAERVLAERGSDETLSVAFLSTKEMTKLNEHYRKKKGPTDVLSFEADSPLLGEILICPRVVENNARKAGLSFEEELRKVLIHGILHLFGYDHRNDTEKKEMKRLEKKYLSG